MTKSVFAAVAFASLLVPGAAQAEPTACLSLRVPVAAGDFLTIEMAQESPCRAEQPPLPLQYDRAVGAPVAAEALPAGTYLGRLVLPAGEIARAGGKLSLVVRSGPVTVVRDVHSLQPLRAGASGFVRTADGEVMAARFIASEAAQ